MRWLCFPAFILFFVMPVRAEEVTSGDFFAGYFLEVDTAGPLYALEVPAEVYQWVRRFDFGDIRVFNSGGEVVPHRLRYAAVEAGEPRQHVDIPFFPLYRQTAATGQADLTMYMRRNESGTIVDINGGSQPEKEEARLDGYLIDLTSLKSPLGGLEFHWLAVADIGMYSISLQQSNDLHLWSPLVVRESLVDLQHGGRRVEKRSIAFTSQPQKYLRLTWAEGESPLHLTTITGYSRNRDAHVRRRWNDLADGVVVAGDKDLVIEYQSTARLPTGSAQMILPDKNPSASITLQSRAKEDDPWRSRCEQVFYNLTLAAGEVQNEPCTFSPTADRYWRALVHEDGAGIGRRRRAPVLQLGWTPGEIVFIARGEPPFLFAFGSGKLAQQQGKGSGELVMQALATAEEKHGVGSARIIRRIELGGEKALHVPPPPWPWKQWLLWAVLIVGVGLLAGMARSLLQEMQKKK